ncbi:putative polyketide synthase [Zopfia rhizophila CBS 207.26]|uniref:Putative polyketide synthase n=1 Tax=Zopfia rhizophila CBS 207.26 TaxID=1314779 RepID=A0A6A6DYR8_9PEZI|nr:putative polyketide synthase [Zopfia rhizophila CBS 207.26]
MREKSILFFADSSQETRSFLDTILKGSKGNGPLLSSFLEKASLALQDEWSQLPSTQRAVLPNFRSLECLFEGITQGGNRHPALHLVEVVLVQLAHFINAHERAPKEPYPSHENSICVGVCFGEIAAATVALSASLNDLIPFAVDAVRLSFRGGILAVAVGNDIEARDANGGSWALSVPRDTGLDSSENLVALHDRLKIPPHKRAWISALGNSTITLGGPPSSLDLISEYLVSLTDFTKVSALRRLAICAPYHADHIFSNEETSKVIRQPSSLESLKFNHPISQNQRKVLIGGSAEYPHEVSAANHILEDALYEIFARPIDWKTITLSCKKILDRDATTSCRVRTFGPDLQGRSLASGLQRMGVSGLVFDAEFSKMTEEVTSSPSTPLAIIGMAGRFPGASNPDEFWNILSQGVDCVQEVPDDRFDKTVHFKDKIWGCFMEKPGLFDPRFFHMSPREAVNTDPAHRLGLTAVQEALDMAGVVSNSTTSTDASRIGTFWGNATEEYKEEYMSQHVDPYYIPGSSRAFAPGRVNFVYNFDGPAVSFDTACSSSMIALHHACNNVWNGDCGTAIIVGSNVLAAPYSYKGLDLGHFLSKTGGCKSFDEYADGYCRGEAVGTIIIKKLTDAVADNDHVLGVIRAISTNHSSNSSSITRPHGPTQEKLFRRLLDQANLKPSDISYVEMHGTGTQAGDTVEMSSVANVLAPEPRSKENPLYLGAVKSNVAHGEGASGITSLIKSLLMLREQKIPPHVGIKSGTRRREPDLDSKNIHIASHLMDWKASPEARGALRRVLISNFSAAGGNTSMILEEASPRRPTNSYDHRSHQVIAVSGKTEKALRDNMKKLLEWTKQQSSLRLSDLSYTTTVRRPRYEFRHSIAASSSRDFEEQMDSKLGNLSSKDYQPADANIVFTGYTNTQSPAMQELFSTSSFFRSEVSRLDQSAQRLGHQTIIPFFEGGDRQELSFIQRQLGYVISQIAMYKLVISWGIRPSTVTGHSLGEYVALVASGIVSPGDMLYIVGERAKALEQKCDLKSHGMLAVRTSVPEAQQHLQSELANIEISCINSPSDNVLSGPIPDLEKAEKLLKEKQIQCSRVDTPLAFHSSQMDAVGDDLLAAQNFIKFNNAHTPLLSPTEGNVVNSASQLGPDYFKRHTRGTVDFCGILSKGVQDNSGSKESIWLEIGPHGICSPMVKLTLGPKTRAIPLMKRDESIWATAPRALSLLYNAGHNIDWKEYHREYQNLQQLLHIPSYVLDEQHYWLPPKKPSTAERVVEKPVTLEQPRVSQMDVKLASKSVHKLVSRCVQDGFIMLSFETNLLEPHLYEVMQGHMMNGSYLCPASLYTDIALTIGQYLSDNEFEVQSNFRACVSTLDIHKPIIAPHSKAGAFLVMRIVAHSDLHDKRTKLRFETKSPDNDDIQVHAQCQVYFEKKQDWMAEWSREQDHVLRDIGNLEAKLFRGLSQRLLSGLVYRLFDTVVVYGDKFKSMKEVLVGETQLQGLASVELYQGSDCSGYVCCPYWMDGLAHVAGFLINGLRQDSEKVIYISPGWDNFRLADHIDPEGRYKSYVRIEDHGSTVNAECYILLGDRIVGKVDGLKFQMLPRSIINRILPPGGQQQPSGHRAPIRQQQDSDLSSQESDAGPDTPESDHTLLELDLDDATPVIGLKTIIYEETGVSEEDIHAETEIVDLGIDSLLSLTISDRLREEYHLDLLPPNLFQIHPTFGALESYIQSIAPKSHRRNDYTATTKTTILSNEKPAMPKSHLHPTDNNPNKNSSDQRVQIEQVRKVIAEQMGLEAADLSPSDDLFDLGLDSLMSLEIVEALRSGLGFELDSNFFMSAGTLEQVEKALFIPPPPTVDIVVDEEPAPATEPSQKLCIVLQGDPNRCARKLFLFPDGSGAANVYARLPIIDKTTCVFGFNSPYLKKGVVSNLTVTNFVSLWIREIKNRQPQGPYHLGGYSSGGYYAYEAAKILMEQKQSVETLICIDTPSRSVYDALPEDVLDLVASSNVVGDGERPTPTWLVDHFRSSIQAVSSYAPAPMTGHSQPKTYLIWAESGIDDLSRTMASKSKFNSGIAKFFAGRRGPIRPHGWAQLIAPKNIYLAKASGNHFNIVLPPNVSQQYGHQDPADQI